jgi:hypothetical protein
MGKTSKKGAFGKEIAGKEKIPCGNYPAEYPDTDELSIYGA